MANAEWEQPLADLVETYNNVSARNALEPFTTRSRRSTWR